MNTPQIPQDELFLFLLRCFQEEGIKYVLIGGQAVRLNGFFRATEDDDLLSHRLSSNLHGSSNATMARLRNSAG